MPCEEPSVFSTVPTRVCVDLCCSWFWVVGRSTVPLQHYDKPSECELLSSSLGSWFFPVQPRDDDVLPDFTVVSPQFSGRSKNSSSPLLPMVVCRARYWPTRFVGVHQDRATSGDLFSVKKQNSSHMKRDNPVKMRFQALYTHTSLFCFYCFFSDPEIVFFANSKQKKIRLQHRECLMK